MLGIGFIEVDLELQFQHYSHRACTGSLLSRLVDLMRGFRMVTAVSNYMVRWNWKIICNTHGRVFYYLAQL